MNGRLSCGQLLVTNFSMFVIGIAGQGSQRFLENHQKPFWISLFTPFVRICSSVRFTEC